jgi:hypothetical protein
MFFLRSPGWGNSSYTKKNKMLIVVGNDNSNGSMVFFFPFLFQFCEVGRLAIIHKWLHVKEGGKLFWDSLYVVVTR